MTTSREEPSHGGAVDAGVTARPPAAAILTVVSLLCFTTLITASCGSRIRGARPGAPEPGSPVVRGARDGLELWWWVVTGPRTRATAAAPTGPTGPEPHPEPRPPAPPSLEVVDLKYDLEDVLVPYLDREVPMPAADRARWRAAGLRVISVPLADLDRIQSRLRTVGAAQRQWLGERPDWTDAVTGPLFEEARTIRIGEECRIVGAGALRLLLRCWLAPSWEGSEDAPGAVLRVELVPEHYPSGSDRTRRSGFAGLGEAIPGAGGVALGGLVAHLSLRDGEACLIVPDPPEADWTQPAQAPDGSEPSRLSVGPPMLPAPTVGEAMLSRAAFQDGARTIRVVLVLVARVPQRFQLTAVEPSSP